MSDKPSGDLQARFYDAGHKLAREAETGSISNVNKELQQFRDSHTPKEFNALIQSIQSANAADVAEDRNNLAGKRVSQLSVPTLILEDTNKDKHPDRIAGRIVADAPKADAPNANGIGSSAKPDQTKHGRETGNYGSGWNPALANQAFDDVLNLRR